MDALEFLKSDHQKIRGLFARLRAVDEREEQVELFRMIRHDLEVHAQIEETVFYPSLAGEPVCRALIESSYEEHQEVKDLLEEIQAMVAGGTGHTIPPGDPSHDSSVLNSELSSDGALTPTNQLDDQLDDQFDDLMESVEAHISQEESELFPQARALLERAELKSLGYAMLIAKEGASKAA